MDRVWDSALRSAIRVRHIDAEQVVISMVRRIIRATDLDDHTKVYQVQRLIAALERIEAEQSAVTVS